MPEPAGAVRSRPMSRRRLPRWSALLVLPLLVGALLLMHGLDARPGPDGIDGARTPSTLLREGDRAGHHDDGHCGACAAGHVMATCLAIVATVASLRRARRPVGGLASPRVPAVTAGSRAAPPVLHPPEAAWIRLAVMRC